MTVLVYIPNFVEVLRKYAPSSHNGWSKLEGSSASLNVWIKILTPEVEPWWKLSEVKHESEVLSADVTNEDRRPIFVFLS